jgi:hypothetical protein
MEIQEFATLVIPFIIVFYLAALLLIRPTRAVLLASLLGGLVMALLNMLGDIIAYYAGWWYYNLNGLLLHLPLPFYITPLLIYGSIVYMLIWRFRAGRGRWFALLLLLGVPIFGFLRDILGALSQSSYTTWKSPLAGPFTVVMWLLMFYAGYAVFQRLAPSRQENPPHDNTEQALENSVTNTP